MFVYSEWVYLLVKFRFHSGVLGQDSGGIGGALLTANNYKMRTLVRKSQEEVQTKLDELMDDKIREMEKKSEKAESESKEKEDKKATQKTSD